MSNAVMVTVAGWAATTPKQVIGDKVPFTSFRLAHTPRHRDRQSGAWVDGRTEWLTVKVWRDAAFTVAASIRKGEPVVAHGRLATEEWTDEKGNEHTGLVLEATALGHDVTRGTTAFARTVRRSAEKEVVAPGATDGGEAEPIEDPWAIADPSGEPELVGSVPELVGSVPEPAGIGAE